VIILAAPVRPASRQCLDESPSFQFVMRGELIYLQKFPNGSMYPLVVMFLGGQTLALFRCFKSEVSPFPSVETVAPGPYHIVASTT